MIPIDEKATIKKARQFLANDFQQFKVLALSRYNMPSGMPSLVAVSGGAVDTVEKRQVAGVDAVAVVDAVRDTLGKMRPDNAKLIELKYINGVRVVDIALRIGYSERGTYKLINQALLEFGMLYGLIVWG